MSMMISSLKRRNDALQQECDNLAQGIDRLSAQLQEAYTLLQKHEPDFVNERMGIQPSTAPLMQPAPAKSEGTDASEKDA